MLNTRAHISALLAAMALALALVGCVNFGPEPIPQEDNTIGFQTVVGLPDVVRAGEQLVYPTDRPFAATAYWMPRDYFWDQSKNDLAEEYFAGVKVEWNESLGAWVANPKQLWPYTHTLTFFAHSPWADNLGNQITNISIDIAQDATIVTDWDTASEQLKGIDLMIAEVGAGQKDRTYKNTPNGVPTVFRHVLSQVQIVAGLVSEYEEDGIQYHIHVRKVELRQLATKGSFSSATERWTRAAGESKDFVVYDYTQDAANPTGIDLIVGVTKVGEKMLILPQVHLEGAEGTQAEIYVEWHDTKDNAVHNVVINLREKFTDSHWGPGQVYTYYLTWDKGAPSFIEFDKPTISADWADGGDYTITID
ncbi:MAG: fimbrillin family protein [Tidjanibacter sp.]|nr:fimbrillin family protein [Tidjanibacter sp.]